MIEIELIRKCFICGGNTIERSGICCDCAQSIPAIQSPVCSLCGMPLISEQGLCIRCRDTQYSFENNTSVYEYCGLAKDLMYLYKFEKCRGIAWLYANRTAEIIRDKWTGCIIVPSPASRIKKKKKGWDQVEDICRILRKEYKLPVLSLLGKKHGTGQKKLNLENRKANLKGRIYIKKKRKRVLEGKEIVLIDDVFTTGATANECAQVLRGAGALRVYSLTIAID